MPSPLTRMYPLVIHIASVSGGGQGKVIADSPAEALDSLAGLLDRQDFGVVRLEIEPLEEVE